MVQGGKLFNLKGLYRGCYIGRLSAIKEDARSLDYGSYELMLLGL